ncbi:hypothetical protein [Saccharopolyspora taberi]|uniref:Uncharacterized protein n=1 Tax=Saccharopolyspora taberi TaxID=60895 RepID=A0ABN3VB82_9PSEU
MPRIAAARETSAASGWTERYARLLEQIEFIWDGPVLAEQAHTDGAPTAPTSAELINDQGGIVWCHRTTLWGVTTHQSRAGASTPLRFAGQYADPETGFHYNFRRRSQRKEPGRTGVENPRRRSEDGEHNPSLQFRQVDMVHKFLVKPASSLAGTLTYSESDHGFAFRPENVEDLVERVGAEGRTSLVADTLQLEVAVGTGRALYVWGYLPKTSWNPANLKLPESKPAEVIVQIDDPPLEESISVSIARVNWDAFFDKRTGLVRVTRNHICSEELVEIAEGVHLGLSGTDLNSFWLKPEFIA